MCFQGALVSLPPTNLRLRRAPHQHIRPGKDPDVAHEKKNAGNIMKHHFASPSFAFDMRCFKAKMLVLAKNRFVPRGNG